MRSFLSCLFAALALVGAPSFAQSDILKHPVQFAKGKSGTTIKGSLTGDQTVDYTLRATAGQTMTVKLSGASSSTTTCCRPAAPAGRGSSARATATAPRPRCRPVASTPSASTRWARPAAAASARTSASTWPLPAAHRSLRPHRPVRGLQDGRGLGPRQPGQVQRHRQDPLCAEHGPADGAVRLRRVARRRWHGGGGGHAARRAPARHFLQGGQGGSATSVRPTAT